MIVFEPISNRIFLLLERLHVIDHDAVICSGKNDMMIVSEIGFAQLGGDIRIAMLPGETAPELVIGGCADEEESYSRKAWGYPTLEELAGGKLTVIGLCNDEVGYIIPDNDFGSIAAPLHYEESVSLGRHTASKLVKEFGAMMGKF